MTGTFVTLMAAFTVPPPTTLGFDRRRLLVASILEEDLAGNLLHCTHGHFAFSEARAPVWARLPLLVV